MSLDIGLHALALCVALAGTETLHGIWRTVWLVRRVGKARALRLSIVSGSLLALGVCWALVPGVGLRTAGQHLALGAGLALFMAGVDLALGHWLLRRPWRQALQDLNPASGNLLLFGLVWLAALPWLLWTWRG